MGFDLIVPLMDSIILLKFRVPAFRSTLLSCARPRDRPFAFQNSSRRVSLYSGKQEGERMHLGNQSSLRIVVQPRRNTFDPETQYMKLDTSHVGYVHNYEDWYCPVAHTIPEARI